MRDTSIQNSENYSGFGFLLVLILYLIVIIKRL